MDTSIDGTLYMSKLGTSKKKKPKQNIKKKKIKKKWSVYVTQFCSSYIFSPEETSSKGYLKLNSSRNIIASLQYCNYNEICEIKHMY